MFGAYKLVEAKELFEKSLSIQPNYIPALNNISLLYYRLRYEQRALEASEKNDLKPLNQLIEILKDPYTQKNDIIDYQIPSNSGEKYQTFCGT